MLLNLDFRPVSLYRNANVQASVFGVDFMILIEQQCWEIFYEYQLIISQEEVINLEETLII